MAEYPRREKDRGASAVELERPSWEEGRDPQEEAIREEQRLEGTERRPGRPGTTWRPAMQRREMKSDRIGSTAPIPKWKEEEIQESTAGQESFDPQAIQRDIEAAGVPSDEAREIAEEVAEDVRPGTTAEDIDSRIRILLRLRDPQWEEDWINSRPEARKLWMTKVADVKTMEDLEPRT